MEAGILKMLEDASDGLEAAAEEAYSKRGTHA